MVWVLFKIFVINIYLDFVLGSGGIFWFFVCGKFFVNFFWKVGDVWGGIVLEIGIIFFGLRILDWVLGIGEMFGFFVCR